MPHLVGGIGLRRISWMPKTSGGKNTQQVPNFLVNFLGGDDGFGNLFAQDLAEPFRFIR